MSVVKSKEELSLKHLGSDYADLGINYMYGMCGLIGSANRKYRYNFIVLEICIVIIAPFEGGL